MGELILLYGIKDSFIWSSSIQLTYYFSRILREYFDSLQVAQDIMCYHTFFFLSPSKFIFGSMFQRLTRKYMYPVPKHTIYITGQCLIRTYKFGEQFIA